MFKLTLGVLLGLGLGLSLGVRVGVESGKATQYKEDKISAAKMVDGMLGVLNKNVCVSPDSEEVCTNGECEACQH